MNSEMPDQKSRVIVLVALLNTECHHETAYDVEASPNFTPLIPSSSMMTSSSASRLGPTVHQSIFSRRSRDGRPLPSFTSLDKSFPIRHLDPGNRFAIENEIFGDYVVNIKEIRDDGIQIVIAQGLR
ncbi:MAG: hypothetical protein ABF893_00825 [Gluconacetobacter liquefaciens]